ncbi:hypothetical protein CSB20_04080, partial [bacterium DOLZORAL124_64_63]
MTDEQKKQNPSADQGANLTRLIEGRLEKMEELGRQVPLYPYSYDRTHNSDQVRAAESALLASEEKVRYAGRIMAKRGTGKTMFVPISDEWGTLQAYFRKDDLGEERFALIKKLID